MRARRTDNNNDDIIAEFERYNCVVHRTNADWDLTVKWVDYVRLVEVKNPDTAYGRRGLNKRQINLVITPYLIRNLDDVAACVASMKEYMQYIQDGIARKLREPVRDDTGGFPTSKYDRGHAT